MLGWCVFILCSGRDEPVGDCSQGFLFFPQSGSQHHIQNVFPPHSNLSGNSHRHTRLLGDSNPKMLTMRIIHCKVYLRPATGTHLKCLSAAEETGIAGRMIQKGSCALVIHLYEPFIRHAWQRDTYKDHPHQCFTLPTSSNTNALQAEATPSAPQLLYGQIMHWRSHS